MKSSRIVQLADLLEQEIRGSKLRPGDPYLSTDDAASKLHVSTQAANNALRVLVKRGVIERRRRIGTYIARLPDETPPSALQRVHLVVHENYLRQEGLLGDGLMLGLQGELPGSQLQFNFAPPHDGHEFANRLIADALRTDGAEGFVLVRAPLAVQRIIASSGLPAVVFGSLQPSVQSLPWIDRDQR
ncbi:MAG: GntR family transcriptional regulator, partial [Patescibacteria group bacterium]|nr:GntR family transcriptional regulator [Patescibacteria group bacterium]